MLYANNIGADQRSLIRAFVVRCLDSIIHIVSILESSSLYLVSMAVSYLVANPEDRFSRDVVQLFLAVPINIFDLLVQLLMSRKHAPVVFVC